MRRGDAGTKRRVVAERSGRASMAGTRARRGGQRAARSGAALLLSLGVCAALPALGCFTSKEEPTAEPNDEIKKYIVDQVPADVTPINVNFDDKITLVGARIEPGLDVAPGKRVKMTLYWRADKKLEEPDWRLFTHVLDGSGDRLMNIDNVGPLRHLKRNQQTWPPSNWEAGKIYVDNQTFTVPRKVKSSKIQVVTGVWKGNSRLPIKAGPALGDNRALVATLTTTKAAPAAKPARVVELEVPRVKKDADIRVDGRLDEDAWKTAADTGAFVNVRTGVPDPASPVQGSAKLLWDDRWLYVGFTVKDENILGGFDKGATDPQLWTKDCVEIMIDPDGDGDNKDYYEIQVNPQNLVFDSQFDDYNKPKQDPNGPFGHQEWSSKLESIVRIKGSIDNSKDKDEGYTAEIRIPWRTLDKAKNRPPKPGDAWRMNLYAMQDNSGVAWSPILGEGNFHKASRFGRIRWVTEVGKSPGVTAVAQGVVPAPAAGTTAPASSASPPAESGGKQSVTQALQKSPPAPARPAPELGEDEPTEPGEAENEPE